MNLNDCLRKAAGIIEWQVEPDLLLLPNIPKPMHGTAPRVVLGIQWWHTTKLAALRSTNYHCKGCGVHKAQSVRGYLECHEVYKINYKKGRMTYERTVPLCWLCHSFIHDGLLQVLNEQGKVSDEEFDMVMAHGKRLLKGKWKLKGVFPPTIGIDGPARVEGFAAWGKWRLVINGKEYQPKYKTERAWMRAYGHNPVEGEL